MGPTTYTSSFNTWRRQHISMQHRWCTYWLLQLNPVWCVYVVNNQATTSAELARVTMQQPRHTHAEPLLYSHFTGFSSNIGWHTSSPFSRLTCDTRRHRITSTVSSPTVRLKLECRSGHRLVLRWQFHGLTQCVRVVLLAFVHQSFGTVFHRTFNHVAVFILVNVNWRHFHFVVPLMFSP